MGDFIRDEGGNWWLLNIKAFKIEKRISQHFLGLTMTGMGVRGDLNRGNILVGE